MQANLCANCRPTVVKECETALERVKDADKAIHRLKSIDSRVTQYERLFAGLDILVKWERKGTGIVPTEAGNPTGSTFAKELAEWRRAMDDDIVEEIEPEVKDAEQRAAATMNPKRRGQALEAALERVRYFKQKTTDPTRLDDLEARLTRALLGQPCKFCGEQVPATKEACPKCGANPER